MHAQGRPEDVAVVMAAIGPLADKAFAEARQDGRRERPEAYAFDGLVALARGGGAPGPGARSCSGSTTRPWCAGTQRRGRCARWPAWGR